MIAEIQEFTENKEESMEVGQQILDKFLGYTSGFSKATLTICLCALINKNENLEDKFTDIKTINIFLNNLCKMPTVH